MRKMFLLPFIFIIILALSACNNNDSENEVSTEKMETTISESVEPFEAQNQDKETVTRDDFEGEWWVANFVFTNCTTVCPPMTRNMKILQDLLDDNDLNHVQLVSFSVDPERDTMEVLKDYGESHGADFSNWDFLTGYDFDTIQDISKDSFKSTLMPPAEGDDQVMHTVSFFLINPDGEVIDRFDGTKQEEMDDLVETVSSLQ